MLRSRGHRAAHGVRVHPSERGRHTELLGASGRHQAVSALNVRSSCECFSLNEAVSALNVKSSCECFSLNEAVSALNVK